MLRILVVDDDRDCATSFARLLALQGHEIRVCFSGVDAIVTADAFAPQVVFLDLMMPGMSGSDVCIALRRIRREPRPKIIALTASKRAAEGLRAAGAGFDSYLLKPAEPADWLRLLPEPEPGGEPVRKPH